MGKKQPKINFIKQRKLHENSHNSKKSKRSNNHSKRSKKKFTNFSLYNGLNSKKSSKKKYFENSSKRKKRKDETPIKNIINNNNITNNNNFFIYNQFYGFQNYQQNKERPEWMSKETENIKDNEIRFNQEILEYVNYITPKEESLRNRENTTKILEKIINKKRPEWKVHPFGSFVQGTSTVFSDLDFEIIIDKNSSRKRDIDELFYLMKILRNNEFSNNIRLIRARVPILKATCGKTGINVDISVNRHNGYQAAYLIKKIITKYPMLHPIIIILKILLRNNNLNEACSGGMSSFLLFHLVFFFFLEKKKKPENYSSLSHWGQKTKIDPMENTTFYKNEEFVEENDDSDYENSDSKSNRGFTLTKAVSNSDDDYNSNEEDSNLLKNGQSSSESDYVQKSDSKEYVFDNKTKFSTLLNSSDENSNNSIDKNNLDNEDDEEEVKILSNTKLLPEKIDKNIIDFLLNFLNFYGSEFDYEEYGLKVTQDETSKMFFKSEGFNMDYSDHISVESIQEEGNDIGKNCYKYKYIKNVFLRTYNTIKSQINNDTVSILQALKFPTV